MKKYSLAEIFYSLQGEGVWAGTPSVFVRFAGCNLSCSWCDTDYSAKFRMTLDELIAHVNQYPTKHIILTGGEPTLQVTRELIDVFHEHGKILHLETNGLKIPPDGIDWVTVSPKGLEGWILKDACELKLVYTGQDIEPYRVGSNCQHYFLQACDVKDTEQNKANINEVIEIVKGNPAWRLSLQTHKILEIR